MQPKPESTASKPFSIKCLIAMVLLASSAGAYVSYFGPILQNQVATVDLPRRVLAFAFIDDQTQYAFDNSGSLYRVSLSMQSITHLASLPGAGRRLVVMPENGEVAVGTNAGTVFVINAAGQIIHEFDGLGGVITSLSVDAAHGLLFVASHDGINDWGNGGLLSVWSLDTGDCVARRSTPGMTPLAVDVNSQERVGFVGFYGGQVSIVDAQELYDIDKVDISSLNPEYSLDVEDIHFNQSTGALSVAVTDSIIVMRSETLEEISRYRVTGRPRCTEWSGTSRNTLFYCGNRCGVVLLDYVSGEAEQLSDPSLSIDSCDVSPTGARLAVAKGETVFISDISGNCR